MANCKSCKCKNNVNVSCNCKCNQKKELKTFKIPVTWEVYSTVEVEATDVEDALKKFHEIENTDGGFTLPTETNYVDESFRLSNDDEDELRAMIEKM